METKRAEGVFKGAAAGAADASADQSWTERPISFYPPENTLFSFFLSFLIVTLFCLIGGRTFKVAFLF